MVQWSLCVCVCVCVCVCMCVCGDENTEPNYPFNESDTFILAIIDNKIKESVWVRIWCWGVCAGSHTRIHTFRVVL